MLGEIKNHGLGADAFEDLFHEFHVPWMRLVGLLRFGRIKDEVEADLIFLTDNRAVAGNHFANVEALDSRDAAQIFFATINQFGDGIRLGGICVECNNVGKHERVGLK